MIHHLSVAALDPEAVAAFFAEMMEGLSVPFPPNPGSYMAFAPDGQGTAVEVYPAGSVMLPDGETGALFTRRANDNGQSATHFALSVALTPEAIRQAAADRGWACFECSRGGHFRVMEVWIDNAWLVEILPPAFAAEYLDFTRAVTSPMAAEEALGSHGPKLVEPAQQKAA